MPGAKHGKKADARYGLRRAAVGLLGVLVVFVAITSFSLGGYLVDPAYGSSMSSRAAEWAREHGAGSLVTDVENWWYSNHPPAVGGRPGAGQITVPTKKLVVNPLIGLPLPHRVLSPAQPPLPGEGVWQPVGRLVDGQPAVLKAVVRVDAVHTSYTASIAWMDTKLLSAALYSGSFIPGGGPYSRTAPISPVAATSLVAAFNAGFRMQDAQGGYYTDHKVILPLRPGAASFVIYNDGSTAIGAWGTEVTMTPRVQSVRQNLDLIVDGGKPVPGLAISSNLSWGATINSDVYAWRSGVGVTADGALVYVGGPAMAINTLADLLIRAGAVRAMELDINEDWVQYSTYAYPPGGAANGANGTSLDPNMVSSPSRYFATWFNRDFFTMSARRPTTSVVTSG